VGVARSRYSIFHVRPPRRTSPTPRRGRCRRRRGTPRPPAQRKANSPARERIDLLLDENTFEETGKLVRHRCRDFGMDEQVVDGDGFITWSTA
jgi:propionyl-CoA carboxylase beta chain